MNALKNLSHAVVLTLWVVAGVALTLKVVFGGGVVVSVASMLGFWLWFGGLAAVTSWLVAQFKAPWAALVVHAATFFVLAALPTSMPFGFLRLGLDLIHTA